VTLVITRRRRNRIAAGLFAVGLGGLLPQPALGGILLLVATFSTFMLLDAGAEKGGRAGGNGAAGAAGDPGPLRPWRTYRWRR